MLTPEFTYFLCNRDDLITRLGCIDPRRYDKTRNYLNGGVTWLSPFVTCGILSTQQIADVVLREYNAKICYRLLFELGWREFFHRTWQAMTYSVTCASLSQMFAAISFPVRLSQPPQVYRW